MMPHFPASQVPGWMRGVMAAAMALAGSVALAGSAHAETFPDRSRPVRIIVPSGAASVVDLLARAYGKAMAETSGLNVIIDNKPGAEMVIGVQTFAAERRYPKGSPSPDPGTRMTTKN